MKASRKDYEAIAKLIREYNSAFISENKRHMFVAELAVILQRSNSLFDARRFCNACEPE